MTRSPTVERGGMRDGEIEVDDSAKENGSRESRSDTDKEREGEKEACRLYPHKIKGMEK